MGSHIIIIMTKWNIIIVNCGSTSINFVEDVLNRGYNPIFLDTRPIDSEEGQKFGELVFTSHAHIKNVELIHEQESYEDTLELVRQYDPLLILPGTEKGVVLATRLSYDLNLKGNSIENIDAMTLKNEMQNRIRERGLRSIRGKVVSSIDEAIEFYDAEGLKEVVLKPTSSAGSVGVHICSNKQEMISALEDSFSKTNLYGEALSEMLVQECIVGDEYIVNTVSCEGMHRVTLVWKYNKIKTAEGAIIYDTCETVNQLNIAEAEMIEYAYDVADAMGIQYGPVHGEYMIDENGPVLIEVNCRPCGGGMTAEFLDKIAGHHETDCILDAYLKPDHFKEKLKQKYQLYAYGAVKFFIVPDEIAAIASPMSNISVKLRSHVKTKMVDVNETDMKVFPKTKDLFGSCGTVFLAHKDYDVIQNNIDYLRNVEKHAFPLVLSEKNPINKGDLQNDLDNLKELIKSNSKYGTGLLVSDKFVDGCGILQLHPDEISPVVSGFDYIILNLNDIMFEYKIDDIVKILLNCFENVKTGGVIIIPKSSYQLFNGGRRGVEALIKLLDLKIELPPYHIKDTIVASKR